MICLDTNIIIAAINQRAATVRQRLMKTLHEGTIVGVPTVVPFELEDAEEAGDIRAALERLGTPIGPYDVLIAAQARRRGAILVTANKNEFSRVSGLQTQDWTIA